MLTTDYVQIVVGKTNVVVFVVFRFVNNNSIAFTKI